MNSKKYGEFERVLNFFSSKKILLFGNFEITRHIVKFLAINDIKIEGYVVKSYFDKILLESHYDYKFDFPIFPLDEIDSLHGYKIASHSEGCYSDLLNELKLKGVDEVLLINDEICNAFYRKFQPRNRNSFILEIDVVDHCNLGCNNCFHFSQIAEPTFMDPESFRKDMKRMSDLSGGLVHKMYLLGGEPLLHPNFDAIIKIAREHFPQTFIQIITNGILLLSAENAVYGNLYEICKEYNICISITEYPVKLDIDKIKKKSREYGVSFFNKLEHEKYIPTHNNEKLMEKSTLDLTRSQNPSLSALNCYFAGNCFTLKDGKLATCPVILNIQHFNKAFNTSLEITKEDYIDIHRASNFFELAEFMARPAAFCSYCDFRNRRWEKWKPSSKLIDEYIEI